MHGLSSLHWSWLLFCRTISDLFDRFLRQTDLRVDGVVFMGGQKWRKFSFQLELPWTWATLFVSTSGSHPNSVKMNAQKINLPLKSWYFTPVILQMFPAMVWIYKGDLSWSQLQFHSSFQCSFTKWITWNCGPGLSKEIVLLCCLFLLIPSIVEGIRPLVMPFPISLCPFLISHVLLSTVKSVIFSV